MKKYSVTIIKLGRSTLHDNLSKLKADRLYKDNKRAIYYINWELTKYKGGNSLDNYPSLRKLKNK